ncbi:MEPFL2 like [Actinidia chinensis var. chinensis]|uniref:Epidermal patterning factor-like protein n=1 Tax=Actinidia chinensis var. chinensis TaxID=1590841 RepID=A0A2R6PA51_ACTCC|nr:MEPFL2 like [Actinidia chinensis var. chinensis]
MGSSRNLISGHKLHHLTISFLLLSISSWTQLRFFAEGRTIPRPIGHSQEEKAILRARIGSRPPRCERRCSTCGHCEAIQVPTNPQIKTGFGKNSSSSMSRIDYARGDESSNYKPLSWKCKCGNSIFNP